MSEQNRQYFDRNRDVHRKTNKPVIHASDQAKESDIPWYLVDRDMTTRDFFEDSDAIKTEKKHLKRKKRHSGMGAGPENPRDQLKANDQENKRRSHVVAFQEAVKGALTGEKNERFEDIRFLKSEFTKLLAEQKKHHQHVVAILQDIKQGYLEEARYWLNNSEFKEKAALLALEIASLKEFSFSSNLWEEIQRMYVSLQRKNSFFEADILKELSESSFPFQVLPTQFASEKIRDEKDLAFQVLMVFPGQADAWSEWQSSDDHFGANTENIAAYGTTYYRQNSTLSDDEIQPVLQAQNHFNKWRTNQSSRPDAQRKKSVQHRSS